MLPVLLAGMGRRALDLNALQGRAAGGEATSLVGSFETSTRARDTWRLYGAEADVHRSVCRFP